MDRSAYVYVYTIYSPYYKCVYVYATINMHLLIYLFIYQYILYFGVVHEERMTDSCIISPDETP